MTRTLRHWIHDFFHRFKMRIRQERYEETLDPNRAAQHGNAHFADMMHNWSESIKQSRKMEKERKRQNI